MDIEDRKILKTRQGYGDPSIIIDGTNISPDKLYLIYSCETDFEEDEELDLARCCSEHKGIIDIRCAGCCIPYHRDT